MYSREVTSETVADVIQVGYIMGERLLRPAKGLMIALQFAHKAEEGRRLD